VTEMGVQIKTKIWVRLGYDK